MTKQKSNIDYLMTFLQSDIEDDNCLHAGRETTNAPISCDYFEPAPSIENVETVKTQDNASLMALWKL